MKKEIHHPVVEIIVVFIIAYLLMYKAWIVGDLFVVYLPMFLGIDFFAIMGEDLYVTWYTYIDFIGIWICGVLIMLAFKNFRPLLQAFSPKRKGNNIKSALIGGLSLGFIFNLLIALVAIATGAVKLHYVGLPVGSFVLLFIAVFIQSGAEELVARVFIYQTLRKNFPKWPVIAIVGNGLFFVLIHLGNPGMTYMSILMLLLVSVMYSLIVYYYDSIWIPVVAHTTWNFTQSIILGLPNSGLVFPVSMFQLDAGTKNFAFDPMFGIEGSILSLVLTVLVCVGLYLWGRNIIDIDGMWDEEYTL